jgi:hypothetical protein
LSDLVDADIRLDELAKPDPQSIHSRFRPKSTNVDKMARSAMPMTADAALKPLSGLVGTWTTEATHPTVPGVVVHGSAIIEWLEGERFLIHRARTDHPDFPDSLSILGFTDVDRVERAGGVDPASAAGPQLRMHYFDSRGVFRIYDVSIDDESWQIWRNAPGFSQRFSGVFTDSNDTVVGRWQLRRDEQLWDDDLEIAYRRRKR